MTTIWALAVTATLYLLWAFAGAGWVAWHRQDSRMIAMAATGVAVSLACLMTIAAIASSDSCAPDCHPFSQLMAFLD
ncbi:hypothetical protein [Aminobacter sp. MET-1]|uniref:hypothetical protein n=1 Tax=Aminobacter sp. MET-1 TaxID=2951085 RepID=UPI00226A98E3|nr:hypothetical protein [Aminobacter sp. MET-1]MCX8570776.1 hypothetical protein [Aminobacter sp. MET-1]